MPRTPELYETSVDCGVLGELDCHIYYFYTPADRGRTSGPPELCYPPEPWEVEIDRIEWPYDSGYLQAGEEHFLNHVIEEIKQACMEQSEAAHEDALCEAAERSRGCDYEDTWP